MNREELQPETFSLSASIGSLSTFPWSLFTHPGAAALLQNLGVHPIGKQGSR